MKTRLHPEARREFDEALDWYAAQDPDVADRFVAEVEAATRAIAETPYRYAKEDRRHRRLLLNRYPYSLVYRVEGAVVVIVSIAHGSRDPSHWHGR